jgi:hypothetical protein
MPIDLDLDSTETEPGLDQFGIGLIGAGFAHSRLPRRRTRSGVSGAGHLIADAGSGRR